MALSAGAKGAQRRPSGLVSLSYSKHWALDSAATILATGQNCFSTSNSCGTKEQLYSMTETNTTAPKRKSSLFSQVNGKRLSLLCDKFGLKE